MIDLAHLNQVGHEHPRRGIDRKEHKTMQLRIGARLVAEEGGADSPCPERQEPEAYAPRRRAVDAQRGESRDHARQPNVVGVVERGGARMGEVHHPRAAVGRVRLQSPAIRAEEVIVVIQKLMQPKKHAVRSDIHPTRVRRRRLPTAKSCQAAWEA